MGLCKVVCADSTAILYLCRKTKVLLYLNNKASGPVDCVAFSDHNPLCLLKALKSIIFWLAVHICPLLILLAYEMNQAPFPKKFFFSLEYYRIFCTSIVNVQHTRY